MKKVELILIYLLNPIHLLSFQSVTNIKNINEVFHFLLVVSLQFPKWIPKWTPQWGQMQLKSSEAMHNWLPGPRFYAPSTLGLPCTSVPLPLLLPGPDIPTYTSYTYHERHLLLTVLHPRRGSALSSAFLQYLKSTSVWEAVLLDCFLYLTTHIPEQLPACSTSFIKCQTLNNCC